MLVLLLRLYERREATKVRRVVLFGLSGFRLLCLLLRDRFIHNDILVADERYKRVDRVRVEHQTRLLGNLLSIALQVEELQLVRVALELHAFDVLEIVFEIDFTCCEVSERRLELWGFRNRILSAGVNSDCFLAAFQSVNLC